MSLRFIRCSIGWRTAAGSADDGWKRQDNAVAVIIGSRRPAKKFSPPSVKVGANSSRPSDESPELNMPDFKSAIRATVANLQLSAEREAEILEELSQHLEERYEEALNHGASEQEAKQSALDELNDSLGHQLKSVERISRARVPPVGMQRTRNRFAGFWEDIRFGLRMLRKQPGFAIAAILTLGIGIGASTAMLSLVQDVLIRPLPYAHSDRLYAIWASSESSGQNRIAASGPDFLDYLEQNRSFAHLAEFIPHFTFTWTGDGEPKLVNCTSVTEEFFPMLGIRPYLGRLYEPREFTYLENDT